MLIAALGIAQATPVAQGDDVVLGAQTSDLPRDGGWSSGRA
jgi:hypothetical protein